MLLIVVFGTGAHGAERLRLAVQKTGTFAWELDVLRERGLDKGAGLDLEVSEVASPEAAKIALLGGSADIILSDWLWVSRQRDLGRRLVFWPYSTALGALMVPAASPIRGLEDLKGKKIAVAGGPLDKSWLLLQALARQSGIDLARDATVIYGAPPLLYQKTLARETEATLNYWNFCVALEVRGFRRILGMDEVEKRLGAMGPAAMVGYVFDEDFAKAHAGALGRFFNAARKAKEILTNSREEWQEIASRAGIASETELALYRENYAGGIPRRPVAEEAADARILYRVLAKTAGPALVGRSQELDEDVFYQNPGAPAER
jgi:NitT/TauT family transport system substrate-binding protein